MKKLLVAFDVDGTLIENGCAEASQAVPNPRIVSLLKDMAHMKNTKILVWSGGGEKWARDVVDALGLGTWVDQYADKEYIKCQECGDGYQVDCHHHTFGTDIKPDIAIDDIQACQLGDKNLIVREK